MLIGSSWYLDLISLIKEMHIVFQEDKQHRGFACFSSNCCTSFTPVEALLKQKKRVRKWIFNEEFSERMLFHIKERLSKNSVFSGAFCVSECRCEQNIEQRGEKIKNIRDLKPVSIFFMGKQI